jgi:hypothetical protein
MIRISITVEAFDAIAATMPLGNVGCDAEVTAKGERMIWVECIWADKARRDARTGRGPQRDDPAARDGGRLIALWPALAAIWRAGATQTEPPWLNGSPTKETENENAPSRYRLSG